MTVVFSFTIAPHRLRPPSFNYPNFFSLPKDFHVGTEAKKQQQFEKYGCSRR